MNVHAESPVKAPPGNAAAPRVNYFAQSPELAKKLTELILVAKQGAIEESILDLVAVRTAQINGCSFCLDMHVKQAKIHRERELRLYHLAAWRESTLFSPRERAALAWTEALTRLPVEGVQDDIYERVRTQLSDKEISDLSFIVVANNSWNRLNVGFRTIPGSMDAKYGLDKAALS
jgi:AhpD family alkylhydroperoxidase